VQLRELSHGPERTFAVVFDTGEEPISGLTAAATSAGLDAAHFTAIGAFERATLGWFDMDEQDYRRIEVDEQVEVVSLVGDITRDEKESNPLKVHAHVVVARSDGVALGGDLLEATVRPTLEVVITDSPAHLRRRHDAATGLALIALEVTGRNGLKSR
jgi:predicted DNA-binding protein with PD1-like motif